MEGSPCGARGLYAFEIDGIGRLVPNATNIEKLRQLWLDRTVIDGALLGPGDPGDFDHGAWHLSCHLVAASAVLRQRNGGLMWVEISYDLNSGLYYPSVTVERGTAPETLRLDAPEGRAVVAEATVLGFVEGNSTGRISAKGVDDPDQAFQNNPRQEYDQRTESPAEGGKVWEHWCTLRDLRPTCEVATSVLGSYVTLVHLLGDVFAAVVARGRHEYHHPEQLCAMVRAGFISAESAVTESLPLALPDPVSQLVSHASPATSLQGASSLAWSDSPRYYMFERRIGSWVKAQAVAQFLARHAMNI